MDPDGNGNPADNSDPTPVSFNENPQLGAAKAVTAGPTSNGDGTDHGWGNHHIMMGGAVAGADIYGTLPRVTVDGPDDSRNGRIVPTIAASQYAATSLRWLGVNETELDELLPTLRNFSQRDLGFMG